MKKQVSENIKRIREAVENNKLVVFIGSGVSLNSKLPSWSGLIIEFAEALGINIDKEMGVDDYLRIAQYFYNERGLKEYYDCINKKFNKKVNHNRIHEEILSLNPVHIITTNYDDLIEQAIDNSHLVFDVVCEDIDLPYTPNGRLLIKMHGDLKRKNIVLKEDDYLLYSQKFKLVETFIKSLFVNHVVLFVGYSLQDMDLKLIMKWVKEILGEHFQRAYFLNSDETSKSQVEENYFKNLGVNIIDKYSLDKEFQDMEVADVDNVKGKNIVRCIKYIKDFENKSIDVIDYFYNRLYVFKELNRVRLKDVIEAMGIDISYTIHQDKFLNVNVNDRSKSLEALINEFVTLDSEENSKKKVALDSVEKAKYIKSIFVNADILGIIINFTDDRHKRIVYKFEGIHKSTELSILNLLKLYNYIEIKLYCEQTYKLFNHHKNKYFNDLIRAYANYLLHRYVSAYEILKKLSKRAYRDKEYIVFYISEYNKRQLVRFIKYSLEMGETFYLEHRDKIVKEAEEAEEDNKKVDLRELFYLLPKKDRATVSFLNDAIINESYFNDKKVKATELKKKVEKEITTLFIGKSSAPDGISELKREVHEFWEYTHNYFLMIDDYSDIRNYYCNYISALLNTYSKKKEETPDEENMIFPKEITHIMPDYIFDELDLYIMSRYFEKDRLIEVFDEYQISEIKINVPNVFFYGGLHNVIQSYINNEYKEHLRNQICNMLIIATKLKFTDEEFTGIFDNVLELLQNSYVNTEMYKTINYFIVKMFDKDVIIHDVLFKLLDIFIGKLTNTEYNNSRGGWELEVLSQISYIGNITSILSTSDSDKVISDELVEKVLHTIKYCELRGNSVNIIYGLLIPIYRIVSPGIKKEIENAICDELNKLFIPKLYVNACINNVIEPSKDFEVLLYNNIALLVQKRKNSGENIIPDPIVTNLKQIIILILNEKIIDKEQFGIFKGIYNLFDFIYEPDTFDFDIFEINWLMRFNEKYLDSISQIEVVKCGIKNKLKREIIKKCLDKRLSEIYFEYFD